MSLICRELFITSGVWYAGSYLLLQVFEMQELFITKSYLICRKHFSLSHWFKKSRYAFLSFTLAEQLPSVTNFANTYSRQPGDFIRVSSNFFIFDTTWQGRLFYDREKSHNYFVHQYRFTKSSLSFHRCK